MPRLPVPSHAFSTHLGDEWGAILKKYSHSHNKYIHCGVKVGEGWVKGSKNSWGSTFSAIKITVILTQREWESSVRVDCPIWAWRRGRPLDLESALVR